MDWKSGQRLMPMMGKTIFANSKLQFVPLKTKLKLKLKILHLIKRCPFFGKGLNKSVSTELKKMFLV